MPLRVSALFSMLLSFLVVLGSSRTGGAGVAGELLVVAVRFCSV